MIHTLSYFPMAIQIFHRKPGLEDIQRLLAGCRDEIGHLPPTLADTVRLLGGRETAEVPQIVLQLLVGLTNADTKGVLLQETMLVTAYLRQDPSILDMILAMYEPEQPAEKKPRGRGRPPKDENDAPPAPEELGRGKTGLAPAPEGMQ